MADKEPTTEIEPETLEHLQARHRKEQRDLVSRITQKKKQATKKTRKGVNDECERLEQELKERQDAQLAALNGSPTPEEPAEDDVSNAPLDEAQETLANLDLNPAAQNQAGTITVEEEPAAGARKKKPNRAKARLARRAADTAALIAAAEQEAANAPNPREIERERMAQQLEKHGLVLHEIRADGHCLYAAIADQLGSRAIGLTPRISGALVGGEEGGTAGLEGYKRVRHVTADFIQAHASSFDGFVEDPLPEHIRKIRETGEWGGHLELLALARAYETRICVLHSDGRIDRIEPEEDEGGERVSGKTVHEMWLGYYKHSHGLGEHYNSLRKLG